MTKGKPEGRWLDTATTVNTPEGKIAWQGVPGRVYQAVVAGQCVATLRQHVFSKQ